MINKFLLCTIVCVVFLIPVSFQSSAQTGTQTPATSSGPTLEVTLKFIGDFMTAESPVGYTETDNDFKDKPETYSFSYHDFRQDGCVLRYGIDQRTTDERLKYDLSKDFSKLLPLAVRVQTVAEYEAQIVASEPALRGTTYTISPEVYILRLSKSFDTDDMNFYFNDRQGAERVMKAVNHAIELCGGTKDQPF